MAKPKVLFISYNAIGDSVTQSQVISYLEQLAMRGFAVSLLTYEKLNIKDYRKCIAGAQKRLTSSGINWYRLRYHKRPSLPATAYDILQGVIYVFFLLNRHKFCVIHARMIVPAAICLILRKFRRFRWLFDMRGLVAEEYVGHGSWRAGGIKFKLVKFVERLCVLNADSVTVLTHKQKNFVSKLIFRNENEARIDIIPSCVDLNRFELRSNEKNEIAKRFGLEGRFIVIYLGSLGTCYLLSEMIDYFLCLHARIKKAFFLFVTNCDKELILNKATEKGLEKENYGIMARSFDEVPEVLSMGNIGIYFINSYHKFGSCPIKFGEYLACGLPVVLNSGIGDTADITKLHRVGVIIESFNAAAYQKSLDELDILLREGDALRNRCRKVASECLSVDLGCDKYQYIHDTLSRRK